MRSVRTHPVRFLVNATLDGRDRGLCVKMSMSALGRTIAMLYREYVPIPMVLFHVHAFLVSLGVE